MDNGSPRIRRFFIYFQLCPHFEQNFSTTASQLFLFFFLQRLLNNCYRWFQSCIWHLAVSCHPIANPKISFNHSQFYFWLYCVLLFFFFFFVNQKFFFLVLVTVYFVQCTGVISGSHYPPLGFSLAVLIDTVLLSGLQDSGVASSQQPVASNS